MMRTLLLVITLSSTGALAQEEKWADEAPAPVKKPRSTNVYPPEENSAEEPVKLERRVREEPKSLQLTTRPGLPARLFTEFGGGLGAAALATLVGVPLGCTLDVLASSSTYKSCGDAAMFLPLILIAIAIPAGTYLAGTAVQSHGSVVGSIVGFLAGGVMAVPAWLLLNSLSSSGGLFFGGLTSVLMVGGTVTIMLFPLVGSVLGHELSGFILAPDDVGGPVSISPIASVSSTQAMAGLSVTF